jgi:uncharacterized protein with GYD domain
MAYYMLQVAYTPEAWAAQIGNPRDRTEVVRPVVESLGGSLDQAWMTFGEYDLMVLSASSPTTPARRPSPWPSRRAAR